MQAWGVYICMYVLKDLWGALLCIASRFSGGGSCEGGRDGAKGAVVDWGDGTGGGDRVGREWMRCDAMRCDGEDLGEGGSGARGRGGGFGKRVTSEGGRDWRVCGGEERSV